MNRKTREFVFARARDRCEYCGLLQAQSTFFAFQIEHIRARQHGGADTDDNLCLACRNCNLHKGTNQSAYDPKTSHLVRLFHPRSDSWDAHFRSNAGEIIGLTPEGRATVALLQMNRDELIRLRTSSVEAEP